MTCDDARRALILRAYGEPPDPRDAASVHVWSCHACRAEMDSLRDVRRAYAETAAPMAEAERLRLVAAARRAFFLPRVSIFAAAAAAALLAVLPMLSESPARAPSSPSPAAVRPLDRDIVDVAAQLRDMERAAPSSLDTDIDSLRWKIRWFNASLSDTDL